MIHPHTELKPINPIIGFGVFATASIPRGTIIWTPDPLDRVLTRAELAVLPRALAFDLERYCWQRKDGRFVLAWDLARFVNHSCAPNCLTTEYGFEVVTRDIAVGEEITNDYADLGMQAHERFDCCCGEPDCRKVIVASDSDRFRRYWNAEAKAAMEEIPMVDQLLEQVLSQDVLQSLGMLERAVA